MADKPKGPSEQWVHNTLAEREEGAVFFQGLDRAIIGVGSIYCELEGRPFVVYDEEAIIREFGAMGMDREEAMDYYNYNVAGLYTKGVPAIVEICPYYRHGETEHRDLSMGEAHRWVDFLEARHGKDFFDLPPAEILFRLSENWLASGFPEPPVIEADKYPPMSSWPEGGVCPACEAYGDLHRAADAHVIQGESQSTGIFDPEGEPDRQNVRVWCCEFCGTSFRITPELADEIRLEDTDHG